MTVQRPEPFAAPHGAPLRPGDPAAYRAVMGAFPTGVTVMTVQSGEDRAGCTASSFNTVSMDPPLILWSLGLRAPSLPLFRSAGHFAVNILAEGQQALARQFSRPAPDKFAGVPLRPGITGAPLIEGAIAHIECRVWARHPGGDHEIMLGEVVALSRGDGRPLVFSGGGFHGLAPL